MPTSPHLQQPHHFCHAGLCRLQRLRWRDGTVCGCRFHLFKDRTTEPGLPPLDCAPRPCCRRHSSLDTMPRPRENPLSLPHIAPHHLADIDDGGAAAALGGGAPHILRCAQREQRLVPLLHSGAYSSRHMRRIGDVLLLM
jgi:hypothetical protein